MNMTKVKVLWSGITGKTGKEAVKVAKGNEQIEIVAGICRSNSMYYSYDELDNIKQDFDVMIDFSHKDSFDKILSFAIKKTLIIGTAGLTAEQTNAFKNAANVIPIFRGGNFRFEVKKIIDEAVEQAKTCGNEITLIETHYETVPLPSQTAKVIAKRILDETGKQILIQSASQSEENTNNWRVGNIQYKCNAYDEKLARDILNIAIMMKDKKANGVMTQIDCLGKI